jgi:predicted small secreted protein
MTKTKGGARIAIMAGVAAMAAMALSGCATVKGAGRDITSAGQAGENAIHGK